MRSLRELELRGVEVPDGGWVHLKGLTQVQSLHINGPDPDFDLAHLDSLTNLRELEL